MSTPDTKIASGNNKFADIKNLDEAIEGLR